MIQCVCGKSIGKSNIAKHRKKNCPLRLSSQNASLEQATSVVETRPCARPYEDIEGILGKLFTMIQSLQEQVNALQKNSTLTINNNVNITIFPFGSEPPSELPQKDNVKKLMCCPSKSIAAFLRLKFQDPRMRNLKITNLRANHLHVFSDSFCPRVKSYALLDVVEQSMETMIRHYSADKYFLWRQWYERMQEVIGSTDRLSDKEWKEQMAMAEDAILSIR